MRLSIVILIVLSFSFVTKADTTANGRITYVVEQDPMPYDGFAVDSPQMKHFRQVNEEKKVLDEKVVKLEDLKFQQEVKIDNLQQNYELLDKQYKLEQKRYTIQKYLYFFGGIALSGAAVYGASKLRR